MKPVIITLLLLCSLSTYSKIPTPSNIAPSNTVVSNQHSLAFVENKGQITDQYYNARTDIQFSIAATAGINIFIGDGAIHYQFSKRDSLAIKPQKNNPADVNRIPNSSGITYSMHRMDVTLIGANKNALPAAEDQQPWYESYFNANTDGHSVIAPAYNRVTYKDIYPHIDWVLYIANGQLEHEFVINEGGKPTDIQLQYSGVTDLNVDGTGNLLATTPQGTITELAPVAFDGDGKSVKSSFSVTGNIVSYNTGHYSGKLVIDPIVEWATYFGGSAYEIGQGIASDASGNVFITGYTNSTFRIATTGAYDDIFIGSYDAFLAKFSEAGALQWATYYGGSGTNEAEGVATDGSGNVYITGKTQSTSGISTAGAYQASFAGVRDAFLAKFSSAGVLLWGTYFGGSDDDQGQSVATDQLGNVYITGETQSASGIANVGAYQSAYAGGNDAFLAKFNSVGDLQWGTYYGGSGSDFGYSVATDNGNNVFITAYTSSSSGIATSGAYHPGFGGGTYDACLAKFDGTGTILWATYFGSTGDDYGFGVTTDVSGNVFITGYTNSATHMSTPGACQETFGGYEDAFIAKFDATGTIQWSTYYGGTGDEVGDGITTDDSGNVYLTGYTGSVSGVATPGSCQTVFGGGADAFIAKFDRIGGLQWGSYLGGPGWDEAWGITVTGTQHAFITGYTNSASDIATTGAYQNTGGGGQDAFLANFNVCNKCATGISNTTIHENETIIYPNPAQDEITVQAPATISMISISNLVGELVYHQLFTTNKVQINVSALPTGIYFVRVNDKEVKKLVKE